jgi:hypothetical protein
VLRRMPDSSTLSVIKATLNDRIFIVPLLWCSEFCFRVFNLDVICVRMRRGVP